MENSPITPATLESIWEAFRETDRLIKESREEMKKSSEEFDKKLEKSRAEADRRAAEADRRAAEADRRAAEADRKAAERAAEADRKAAEREKESKALSEKLDKLGELVKQTTKQMGGMCNSNGDAAQEFFFNSLKRKKKIFGEKFDIVIEQESRNSIVGFEAEYDIIMFNGISICIIEVKYKAEADDIQSVLQKAITFRINFPEHNNKKIYLALAGMSFNKNTEEACKDNGIAILKQVGDTIEVYDENLKTF